jgi:seryl-tRNA(Sec) selenium transferase
VAVAAEGLSADELAARLRAAAVPVVGRIAGDRLLLDPRTVLPGQAGALLDAVARATIRKPLIQEG